MSNKYLAKIIASDQEGLQMISACSSGAKVKVSDIKYLESNKVFLLSIERTKIETNQENKKINSICRFDFVDKVKSDAPIVLRIAISLSLDLTLIIVVQRTLNAATPIIKKTRIPIINFSNWTA